MHNALAISEVFCRIIDYLEEDTYANDGSAEDADEDGRRALAVLARTCRAFSEPALDAVWRRLHNLLPFLLCVLGNTFRDTYTGDAPLPPFNDDQWSIVSRYTPRVQELTLDHNESSVEMLQSVWFRTTLLLPNLRSLCWSYGDHIALPFIRLLLSPSLVHLSWWVGDGNHTAVLAFLERYHILCPHVKSLELLHSPHSKLLHVTTALSRAIARSPNLESLSCNFNEATLIHVARSRCLKKLSSDLSEYEPDYLGKLAGRCAPDHPPFVNLRTLNLHVKNLSSVIPFFQSQHQPFEEVSLNFRMIVTPEIFHEFFSALVSPTRRRTLRRIRLYTSYMTAAQPEIPVQPLNFQALSPLMAFNLQCFDITIRNPIALNDDEFVQLVQAWPELESLELYEYRGKDYPDPVSIPTLRGLLLLLARCPKLRDLGLSLDATDIPSLSEAESLIRNTVITRLRVGSSPIEEPVSVIVQFLLRHLPSLRTVVASACDAKHLDYHWMWRGIDKEIRGLGCSGNSSPTWTFDNEL